MITNPVLFLNISFFLGYVGSSLLRGLFSSWREQGRLTVASPLVAERGLGASVAVVCGLCSCRSPALEHRLDSCGSWA